MISNQWRLPVAPGGARTHGHQEMGVAGVLLAILTTRTRKSRQKKKIASGRPAAESTIITTLLRQLDASERCILMRTKRRQTVERQIEKKREHENP